ncbi:MAG: Asp-tRNA(Asn)/Glu-tRNA(Gln) amidotransferase subunit GatB [Burkholderiales bacterium]
MNKPALIRGFEVVIGIETHAQLSTHSKIFSGTSTQFGAAANTQASAVDLALPGTLPVMNRGAVERAIRFGLAVNAKIAPLSIFARKNYFYPDLPKGYQISQYETPVVQGGVVEFLVGDVPHKVNLTRAHLEEDAGKSLHEDYQGQTGIDLNRAGTPLLEIVTEPDMRSSAEAVEYAKTLHQLVRWIGICDGNMQEGSFRCDANVSVRKPGAPYGTRREIKNLNSFKFMQQAIDFEVQWQIDLLEDGGTVQQATVLFDPASGETRAMRSKEDAHDYRYFPDPDLPPLAIGADWIERVRGEMPELPDVMAARFQSEYGLPAYDAVAMTQSQAFAAYFETAAKASGQHKLVANWLMGEVSSRLNAEEIDLVGCPVPPDTLAQLVTLIAEGVISNKTAKDTLFPTLWSLGKQVVAGVGTLTFPTGVQESVESIVIRLDLKQLGDTGELDRIIDEVLAANPKSVEEFRAGKEKAFNALVGQAMKATKGKGNPTQVNELLKKKLG